MKRQHWMLGGGLAAAFLGGGWLYASPYLTLYQMYRAVENRDVQGISNTVDFPALRESIRGNLQSVVLQQRDVQRNPLMTLLGAALGGTLLNPVLDQVVTPEGVMALLEGDRHELLGKLGKQSGSGSTKPEVDVNPRYESFNKFAVGIKPKGQDIPPIDVLLSRQGLSWKVTGVRLPLGEATP